MINFKILGNHIRAERKARNLTQEQLAEILDVATIYISRIENGALRPSLTLIEKMSSFFGVDEAELMFGMSSETDENKILVDKLFSLNPKKRHAVEQIIDVISEL